MLGTLGYIKGLLIANHGDVYNESNFKPGELPILGGSIDVPDVPEGTTVLDKCRIYGIWSSGIDGLMDTKITCRFMLEEDPPDYNTSYFGTENGYRFMSGKQRQARVCQNSGRCTDFTEIITYNTEYNVTVGNGTVIINGVDHSSEITWYSSVIGDIVPICLGSAAIVNPRLPMIIYTFKIFNSTDNLIADYVPVKLQDNTISLYDVIRQQYITKIEENSEWYINEVI